MRRIGSALFFALMIGLCSDLPTLASTINFDDIDAAAGDVILGSYQGYNWTNTSVYTNTPGLPGFNNSIVSAPNAAYAGGDTLGSPIVSTISSSSAFNLVSGYFGAGWYDGLSVTVEGLYNAKVDFSKSFVVNTSVARLFTLNFTEINEVEIYSTILASTTDPYGCGSSGCSQITLDNLTLTPASEPPPSTMPEPAVFFLSALGFSLMICFRCFSRIAK